MQSRNGGKANQKRLRRAVDCCFQALEPRRFLSGTPLNAQITSDPNVQQFPSIVADPNSGKHVALAYMDRSLVSTGYAGIAVEVSSDAGNTWSKSSVPLPAGFEQGAANPTVQFDDHGHLYVSYMAVTFLAGNAPQTNPGGGARPLGFQANNGVFVSRSDDDGAHWKPAASVTAHQFDGKHQVPFDVIPTLTIDTHSELPDGEPNSHYETLYVGWTRYYPAGDYPGDRSSTGGSDIFVAVSSDSGQTWITRTRKIDGVSQTALHDALSDGGSETGFGKVSIAHPTVGPEGELYLAYFAGGHYGVDYSDNAAQSFDIPSFKELDSPRQPFPIDQASLYSGAAFAPENPFRTLPQRAVAADPARRGVVYAAEAISTLNPGGQPIDRGQVLFSFSTDYGKTWLKTPIIVNDDNENRQPAESQDDVAADQFMVQLDVSPDGKVGLIWLDTRVDPANKLLNVFASVGTFSTNAAGEASVTFTPNFRITDQSFNSDLGAFTDALGRRNVYIGDGIGLTMSTDSMYAAWTDTRQGNQDVFASRVPLNALPAPPHDRFEPNDIPASATDLGAVVQRHLPKLHAAADDEDWIRFRSLSTGTITASVSSELADGIHLELFDSTGSTLLARATDLQDSVGKLIGKRLVAGGQEEHTYLLHIRNSRSRDIKYSLDVESLTADLGGVAYRKVGGALQTTDRSCYLLEAVATGSLSAKFSPGLDFAGDVKVQLLDPHDFSVLATASGIEPRVVLNVIQGQSLVLRVIAAKGAHGSFNLKVTNLDEFSDAGFNVLHFPAGLFPSQEATADFNRDGVPDVAIANAGSNTASILLANSDGTFQAPRQFAVGAFQYPNPEGISVNQGGLGRAIAADDFDGDGIVDLALTNYDSDDVSILLGHGDGTFAPQRRFNALPSVFTEVARDVNDDDIVDLVIANAPVGEVLTQGAVLLGRGDGSFLPPKIFQMASSLEDVSLAIADLDGDSKLDLVVAGGGNNGVDVFKGDGLGGFEFFKHFDGSRQAPQMIATDINRDGKVDIVAASLDIGNQIWFLAGNGDGSFQKPQVFDAGQSPSATALTDWGSVDADGNFVHVPDGLPDLVVANAGTPQGAVAIEGPPEIVVLPNLGFDNDGAFLGYGDAVQLALAEQPLDVKIADFDRDGSPDIGVIDRQEFFVIYGKPPAIVANDQPESARDLGTVVHLLQPTLTIVPGHEDAWYSMTVPTEAVRGSGDEVIDVAGLFEHERGAGLSMQAIDADGRLIGAGEHIRISASQGSELKIHVLGASDARGSGGSGAYTLDITVLPQLASVEGQPLVPGMDGQVGGATASLVLSFQGDRLDADAAEDPDHYSVTWLGPDQLVGGGDDQLIQIGADDAQPVVYNSGANVDVVSGIIYPTAVRQTVTLLFRNPLPAGSYLITVAPEVSAAPFNQSEQLASLHPVVTSSQRGITEGADHITSGIVTEAGEVSSFAAFSNGTPFLSQLHADLGALLDRQLTAGDAKTATTRLLAQMRARFAGGLGNTTTALLALFIDPAGLDIADPSGQHARYSLTSGKFGNTIANAYLAVASNVEVAVIPALTGTFHLNVSDVPATARGGVVIFDGDGVRTISFTEKLRGGEQHFAIAVAAASVVTGDPLPAPRNTDSLSFGGAETAGSLTRLVSDQTASPSTAAHSSLQANNIATPTSARARLITVRQWPKSWRDFFDQLGKRMQAYLARLEEQLPKQQREKTDSDRNQAKPKTGDGNDAAPKGSDQQPPTNRTQAAPLPQSPQAVPAGDISKPAADTGEHRDEQTRRSSKSRIWTVAFASLFASGRLITYQKRSAKRRRRVQKSKRHLSGSN